MLLLPKQTYLLSLVLTYTAVFLTAFDSPRLWSEKMKIKIHQTITLPVVFMGVELGL
jgi:hypothetical protein